VTLAERVPFRYLLAAMGMFALFLMYPPHTFFIAFLLYALSGPGLALYRRTAQGRALGGGRDNPPSL
jgi:CDP-diacylglycerol--serine O-phosphatidyltransferase